MPDEDDCLRHDMFTYVSDLAVYLCGLGVGKWALFESGNVAIHTAEHLWI